MAEPKIATQRKRKTTLTSSACFLIILQKIYIHVVYSGQNVIQTYGAVLNNAVYKLQAQHVVVHTEQDQRREKNFRLQNIKRSCMLVECRLSLWTKLTKDAADQVRPRHYQ